MTRAKLGLEMPVTSRFLTLKDAWHHWLEHWCPPASKRREQSRYHAHVETSWIGEEKLTELSGERIERWFVEKRAVSKARTVNAHRRIMRCVFNALIRHRLFRGMNPVKETKPLEEEEFDHQLLSEPEFRRLLPHVGEYWKPLFVIAYTCGLRRGEIFALRKDRNVVDLEKRTLTPRASNSRSQPKGKKIRSVPLFEESLAALTEAWERTNHGELLFPGHDGKIRSENSGVCKVLRGAMARAGLHEGWNHTCRRPGCDGRINAQRDEQQRKCPEVRLGALAKAGGAPGALPRPSSQLRRLPARSRRRARDCFAAAARHSSIEITNKIYAHRTVETLRDSLDKTSAPLERELERLARAHPAMRDELQKLAAKAALNRHRPLAAVT